MKILVIGAGAWGTALAMNAASRHTVHLWARDGAQAAQMQAAGENTRYLPGIPFPDGLQVTSGDVQPLASGADLVVLGTPMAALRSGLAMLRDCMQGRQVPVAWLSKGFEAVPEGALAGSHGLLGNEVCAQVAAQLHAGVLSGPSFAQEVARHQPTALVAASRHAEVRDTLVAAFHGDNLRVYANDDITGVEVGGAVKNVLAIATGLCDGLNLGLNARAALVTRGLAEMTRLGVALGAQHDTFMGLSGLGDLVLTATGDLSRNRKIGLLLAQGKSLHDAVQSLGHVAEGVYSARTVLQRAQKRGVEMPITETTVALLDGSMPVRDVVQALMGREPRAE